MSGVFDVLRAQGAISDQLCERMLKTVGFRNLAVREYDKVNWEIVHRILTEHLKDFREFAGIAESL